MATAIASITWNVAVEWFAGRLGADHTLGTRHGDTGIRHVWPSDKGRWLRDLSVRLGLQANQVAAVGDSANDRDLLEAAGLRFFVGETPPAILDPDMFQVRPTLILQPFVSRGPSPRSFLP